MNEHVKKWNRETGQRNRIKALKKVLVVSTTMGEYTQSSNYDFLTL